MLYLQHEDWSEAIKYTFTLKVTKTAPKAVLSSSTIAINTACYDSNSVTVKLNQSDAVITGMSKFTAAKANTETAKIDVAYEDGKIVASIKAGKTVKKGTYSFYAYPEITYQNADYSVPLGKLTVKVKIEEQTPYLKLKSSTFKLNSSLVSQYEEVAETAVTMMKLPAEGEFAGVPNTEDMEIYCNKAAGDNLINVSFSEEEGNMQVSLKKALPKGKYSIELYGLKVDRGDGSYVELKPLKFKISTYTGTPAVTLKASGKINVLNEESEIVYTPKITNFTGKVDGVYVYRELIDDVWVKSEDAGLEGMHFQAEVDQETGKIHFGVNSDNEEMAADIENTTYRVQLAVSVAGITIYKDITFKPVQTLPKVKVENSKMTFYKGVPGYSVSTTVERSKETEAPIYDVEWSSKIKETATLRKAFSDPVYDVETGELTVTLKNPTLLKKGTDKLIFAIRCKNQLADVEGTNFTINVTVK